MIITISGDIGSGKSTCGRLLQQRLGYQYLSTGAIQRKIAQSRGLTTLELNKLSDSDKSIDQEIDNYTRNLNKSSEDYVVDSRLAWHFIPSSYKVFLRCNQTVAAQRIMKDDTRISDEKTKDSEELLQKIRERRKSERERFKKLYHIDFESLAHYDIVVDSSHLKPEEIVDLILDGLKFYSE